MKALAWELSLGHWVNVDSDECTHYKLASRNFLYDSEVEYADSMAQRNREIWSIQHIQTSQQTDHGVIDFSVAPH